MCSVPMNRNSSTPVVGSWNYKCILLWPQSAYKKILKSLGSSRTQEPYFDACMMQILSRATASYIEV